jgi:hypothetical protein
VLRDCVTFVEHANRKTVTTVDVVFALKRIGRPIYGLFTLAKWPDGVVELMVKQDSMIRRNRRGSFSIQFRRCFIFCDMGLFVWVCFARADCLLHVLSGLVSECAFFMSVNWAQIPSSVWNLLCGALLPQWADWTLEECLDADLF